jgi:putative SOS response-associated peptidase YedK
VILREQDEADWLNPRLALDAAQALLVPLPTELLMAYEVSLKVNSPAFHIPEALQLVVWDCSYSQSVGLPLRDTH